MAGVNIKNLVKRYGSVTAVAGVDLDVAAGEFVVLLGPSGCGKTTTLRCVAGLEDITSGRIMIGDQIVSSDTAMVAPEKREIGMVFQSYAIWPHLSVKDNVAFGLKLKKLPAAEIADRVGAVLELVGLADYGDRSASQLSGGQQQRVALARAVVHEPRVLLFDEPLSNLDAKLRERMRFELKALQRRLGITSLYVTHDQQEALVIADRVVLMDRGQIAQVGTPREVYERPTSHFSADFVGLANIVEGKVVAVGGEDGLATVRLDEAVDLGVSVDGLRVGETVKLVMRPESLEIADNPVPGDNAFEATLIANHYLGNLSDAFLEVGGLQLRAQLSPPKPWEPGEKLWVRIPPAAIAVLPVVEGRKRAEPCASGTVGTTRGTAPYAGSGVSLATRPT